MGFKGLVSAAVLLAMTPPLAAETIEPPSRPTVLARSFNYAGVPAGHLQKAQAQAETILWEAGVTVSWLDCRVAHREPADASSRCEQPLGATDLMLRVGSAKNDAAQYVSLGFSLVNVADGTAPYLATVYADLVANVAKGAGVDTRELLGRAMAHEIGHLLLATNQHAATGLMRAAWSRAELRRNNTADWQFLSDEAETMCTAIATRAAAPQASAVARTEHER
jgi:hypothetical protein